MLRLAPRGLVLLLVALALAGATVWLTAAWLDRAARAAAAGARGQQTVELLVAARDLAPGDVLSPVMLGTAKWPKSAAPPQHMPAAGVDPASLVGAVVRVPVAAGQPLTASQLAPRGEQGVLAALITPGRRAVTIPVSAAAGLAGLVGPGDRVDVLMTASLPGSGRVVGLAVVEDVRVLGVDRRLRGGASPDADEPPSTVTLEVTPQQAEAVAVAQELGRLSLALRAPAPDPGGRARPGRTLDTDVMRLPPAALADAAGAAPLLPASPAVPASAIAQALVPAAGEAPAAGPARMQPDAPQQAQRRTLENGVQVVRGSSMRAGAPPAAADGDPG